MAAIAKKQSSTGWWLWGGVAVAIIAVAAVIYTFDPFGFDHQNPPPRSASRTGAVVFRPRVPRFARTR
jgi:hypothetical protein